MSTLKSNNYIVCLRIKLSILHLLEMSLVYSWVLTTDDISNRVCVVVFFTISTATAPAKQQNVSASVYRVFTIPNVIYDVVYDQTKLSKQNIVLLFSRQWIVQFTDNGGCSNVYVHYYYGGPTLSSSTWR